MLYVLGLLLLVVMRVCLLFGLILVLFGILYCMRFGVMVGG